MDDTDPKSHPVDNAEKDPSAWVSGDDPMTGAQASYLKTLSEQAHQPDVHLDLEADGEREPPRQAAHDVDGAHRWSPTIARSRASASSSTAVARSRSSTVQSAKSCSARNDPSVAAVSGPEPE